MLQKGKNNFLGATFSQWLVDNDEFIGKYVVVCLVALSQGVLALSEVPINFLYKDNFEMSPSQVSFAIGLIHLPWVFKPFYGILSDSVPICGERRKSYIMIFSFIAFVNWNLLAFYVKDRFLGLIILFSIQLCTAFCNVVGEAMLVEISQLKSKKFKMTEEEQQTEASHNVSLFFGVKSIGTLSTAYLGGVLLGVMDKHYIFAITGIFPLLLSISSIFMKDHKHIEDQIERQQDGKLSQMQKFLKFVRKPQIYQPIVFILLFMMTPTSSSSMFFFYTNKLGFEPQFMGSLKFIHAAGTLFAIFLYNKYLKTVKFKLQFIASTFVCVVLGLSQLMLITRINLDFGIPDKIFCLGDSIIIQIVGELNILPILVLACRLCPRNIEATMYAMIMSTINLGSLFSSQLGGVLIYILGITENNFDNLWILNIIANVSTAIPLVCIHLIDQQGQKLSDGEIANAESTLSQEQNSTKQEIKGESSSLLERSSNLSTDVKSYGSINNDNQSLQHPLEMKPVNESIQSINTDNQ